jgi:hypothetical protein
VGTSSLNFFSVFGAFISFEDEEKSLESKTSDFLGAILEPIILPTDSILVVSMMLFMFPCSSVEVGSSGEKRHSPSTINL